jgi:neutral trehalase
MTGAIDTALQQAATKLRKVDGRIDDLPQSVANLLLVYSAQGKIDNGGYQYFFEEDWRSSPPYSRFVAAYLAIGCGEQAEDMDRVVSTFPFGNPHLNKSKREQYIKANYGEDEAEVKGWGDAHCGDPEVWEKLAGYYLENVEDFV